MKDFLIAPSILSADFARLGAEVDAVLAAGADIVHFDVMDNHYVPNLTIGPMVCKALRKHGVTAPIDAHLMVRPVDRLIGDFIEAGASWISFHPEASDHIDRSLQLIRSGGCKAGLVLNPATPVHYLEHVYDKLDFVLLMSVNPGFGGQSFIPSTLPKLRKVRQMLDASGHDIRLEVDGGVGEKNIREIAQAGADTFVAGSAIFGKPDYKAVIDAMRAELAPGLMLAGIRAVLFDLDGTLVDSVPDIAVAVDRLLADLGRAPAGEARVRFWVGNGGRMLVRRALAGDVTGVPDDDPLLPRAMDIFFAHYNETNGAASRLYPGVAEALDAFAARGLPMATITNKPHRYIAPLYAQLGILHHFPVLVGGDTLAVKKPDPAPLLLACERLAIAPRDALMVGDSRNDIDAARAAGCPVVAVDYGYNYGRPIAEDRPDRVVSDLRELL